MLDTDRRHAEPLLRAPDASAHDLARLVVSDLPGTRITTDEAAGTHALLHHGGTTVRHATMMSARAVASRPTDDTPTNDLAPLPTTPAGIDGIANQLAAVRRAAHPRGHRDHDPADDTGATTAPLVGLAVTMSNPATQLYHSLGFTDTHTSWTVDMPPHPVRPGPSHVSCDRDVTAGWPLAGGRRGRDGRLDRGAP